MNRVVGFYDADSDLWTYREMTDEEQRAQDAMFAEMGEIKTTTVAAETSPE